ncbi:excinuclease ABC subunit UvrA [Candidatus Sumerlaeota bacterium]|nr:excinuclease ABC subunit UvrA [Candidatus Sumerlaeota bacterium]
MRRTTSNTPPVDTRRDASAIEIVGARTHNLKNVTCSVRRGKLTVVTGVSGSGKSSLAFDTLYAEGQRRYVESMSTYARQFLERMQRPDVDAIHNVPPAIALEQKNSVTNARSTIGTATEINDFLRLLFARVGHVFCPDCGVEVASDSPESAAMTLEKLPEGKRLIILAPVEIESVENLDATLDEMRRQGFTRALAEDGTLVPLEEFRVEHLVERKRKVDKVDGSKRAPKARKSTRSTSSIFLLADRVATGPRIRSRLAEALELAFRAGGGRARVRDADSGAEWAFSSGLVCNRCGRTQRKPEPALFSFSSPLGACPRCEGFGRIAGIDMDKVIPNWNLTLMDDPIVPWNSTANREMYDYLRQTVSEMSWHKPLEDLSSEMKGVLLEGRGKWPGIRGFFGWYESRRYKVQARVLLARYRAYTPCPDCGGARLVPEALHVRVDGRTIADVVARSIEDLHAYFDALTLPAHEEQAASRLLSEIRSRLRYLDNVGLGYLTLDRQTRTLSGGESQRINLATALGSALTDTLYVLDEPTVGLHSRDTMRLLAILQALRESGNTVVVVEHDPDIILGADDVLDIGPASGERGGQLLYAGPVEGLLSGMGVSPMSSSVQHIRPFQKRGQDARATKAHERDTHATSLTARYLARSKRRVLPSRGRKPAGWIAIRGARAHNLQNLDVRLPLGVLACVTGVSGSGKSTLVHSILYSGFRRLRDNAPVEVGMHDAIDGIERLRDIVLVDQRPLGRSSRSNPVTYVKAYDPIRALFASTREAKRHGIRPGHFSFNVEGGRCETCRGAGVVTVDMHFLADVEVTCDDCDGKRFQRRVLDVAWNGRNIDDVLDMTVSDARSFFADRPKIRRALDPLASVGLGYIRLGQSTATLSGGEAQRLKLAGFLAANRNVENVLMLFDEPTTGLHAADLEILVELLHRLVDRGASVLVIEHNLDLIGHADWIVDLGPEGGASGGRIVAEGLPEAVMACPASHTGRFLKERFRELPSE